MIELERKAKIKSLELTERTCNGQLEILLQQMFRHPSEQGKPYCKTHVSIAEPVAARREKQSKINS